MDKTLKNTTASQAKDNVPDLLIWGNGDMWKLICKAHSEKEKWMKTTKAIQLPSGCLIQTETQQGENLSQALEFVPGLAIKENKDNEGKVISRKFIALYI